MLSSYLKRLGTGGSLGDQLADLEKTYQPELQQARKDKVLQEKRMMRPPQRPRPFSSRQKPIAPGVAAFMEKWGHCMASIDSQILEPPKPPRSAPERPSLAEASLSDSSTSTQVFFPNLCTTLMTWLFKLRSVSKVR